MSSLLCSVLFIFFLFVADYSEDGNSSFTADVCNKLETLSQYHTTARNLLATAQNFSGSKQCKPYLELEEKLTTLLLRVDAIQVNGHRTIRIARKEVVNTIQTALTILDNVL